MPDPNKLDALQSAGFLVRETCGLCKNATFRDDSSWGVCSLILYEHGRHTGVRDASIHRSGYCPSFDMEPANRSDLVRSGFDRFMGGPS